MMENETEKNQDENLEADSELDTILEELGVKKSASFDLSRHWVMASLVAGLILIIILIRIGIGAFSYWTSEDTSEKPLPKTTTTIIKEEDPKETPISDTLKVGEKVSIESTNSMALPRPLEELTKERDKLKIERNRLLEETERGPEQVPPENRRSKNEKQEEPLNSVGVFDYYSEESDYFTIPIRSVISAVSLDTLSNTDFQKEVLVRVMSNFTNKDQTAPIKNATLIGNFQVTSSVPDRIFIRFHTIVYEDGKDDRISAFAKDASDGKRGLKAKVDYRPSETILKTIYESAKALLAVATYEQTGGLSGKLLEASSAKQIDGIETNTIVTLQKETFFNVVFDRPIQLKNIEVNYEY